MTLERDVSCLKGIRMFQNMEPARLKLLALMSERVEYAAGEHIFRQGHKPDAVYFILSGEVDISRDTPQARYHAMSLEQGTFFGAAAVLTGAAYPAAFMAKTDVEALRLPKDLFLELIQTVPEFALAVARDLAARIFGITNAVFEAEKASKANA